MAAGSMFLILEHSSLASVIVLGSLAFSVKSVIKSCRSSSRARTRFARGDVGLGVCSGFFVGVFAFVGAGFFGVIGPACFFGAGEGLAGVDLFFGDFCSGDAGGVRSVSLSSWSDSVSSEGFFAFSS